jgi:hypothetical protein
MSPVARRELILGCRLGWAGGSGGEATFPAEGTAVDYRVLPRILLLR